MSEYQFYEFQAIDRPLSPDDRKYIQSLSSRVKLTGSNAQFLYNYGDFRGKPEELLDRCFDIMVYVANFGVRQLMLRFPKKLVNAKLFDPYCIKHGIEVITTSTSTILNIHCSQESYYGWLDEETYVSSLMALREEILNNDLRLLYLAWLAVQLSEYAEGEPEELIEPPVPANLQNLSPALAAFAELFEIDRDLINAAAAESPTATTPTEPIADWIAALSETERNAYLLRVAQGETHVGAELIQHLRQKFGKKSKAKSTSPERSLADLIAIAEEQCATRNNKAKKAAATARQKHLKQVASKTDEIWQEVFRLIDLGQVKPYEEAVKHLVDLRDVANNEGSSAAFQARLTALQKQYKTRSGLLTRIRNAHLP
jgi:hypothetical protein